MNSNPPSEAVLDFEQKSFGKEENVLPDWIFGRGKPQSYYTRKQIPRAVRKAKRKAQRVARKANRK